MEPDPLISQPIGNYVVKDLLGSGGMGAVYLAEHPAIGRRVAIKVLASHLSQIPRLGERFLSEARALALIEHPNVIEIYDFGKLPDGRLFYVMELLRGHELGKEMNERGKMSPGEVLPFVEQICAGLQATHEKGIIHRDLKPENIFVLDRDPMVIKLLDFGIAKLQQDGMSGITLTQTGVVMGTPLYISPEQAAGRVHDIGPQTDLYSLGVILFWMLSGQPPFFDEVPAMLLAQHLRDEAPSLGDLVPELPPSLVRLVGRCLAKEPGQRPGSARELARGFASTLEDVPRPPAAAPPAGSNPARTRLDPASSRRLVPGQETADPGLTAPLAASGAPALTEPSTTAPAAPLPDVTAPPAAAAPGIRSTAHGVGPLPVSGPGFTVPLTESAVLEELALSSVRAPSRPRGSRGDPDADWGPSSSVDVELDLEDPVPSSPASPGPGRTATGDVAATRITGPPSGILPMLSEDAMVTGRLAGPAAVGEQAPGAGIKLHKPPSETTLRTSAAEINRFIPVVPHPEKDRRPYLLAGALAAAALAGVLLLVALREPPAGPARDLPPPRPPQPARVTPLAPSAMASAGPDAGQPADHGAAGPAAAAPRPGQGRHGLPRGKRGQETGRPLLAPSASPKTAGPDAAVPYRAPPPLPGPTPAAKPPGQADPPAAKKGPKRIGEGTMEF